MAKKSNHTVRQTAPIRNALIQNNAKSEEEAAVVSAACEVQRDVPGVSVFNSTWTLYTPEWSHTTPRRVQRGPHPASGSRWSRPSIRAKTKTHLLQTVW